MALKQWVAAVVVFTGMFYLLYDIAAYAFGGYRITLSWFTNTWLYSGDPSLWIVLGFTLGALFVHFTKWSPGPINDHRLLEGMNDECCSENTERLGRTELRSCRELDRTGRPSE